MAVRAGSNGNEAAGLKIPVAEDFAALERLPPNLRRALQDSRCEFSAIEVEKLLSERSEQDIMTLITKADPDLAVKTELKFYGPKHPEVVAAKSAGRLHPNR